MAPKHKLLDSIKKELSLNNAKTLKTVEEYTEEVGKEFLLLRSKGKTISQVCAALGIGRKKYEKWKEDHVAFNEIDQRGLELFQAWLEDKLFAMIEKGKEKGFKPLQMVLNNLCKKDYGVDKQPIGNQINIQQNIQSLNTTEELTEVLKKNLAFLAANNIIDADFLVLEDKSNDADSENS